MQSTLAKAASNLRWALHVCRSNQGFQRTIASSAPAYSRSKTVDPAIHSGELESGPSVHRDDPQGTDNSGAATEVEHAEQRTETEFEPSGKGTEPLVHPKRPPHASSPRLESAGVTNPSEHSFQQKRRRSSTAALEDVSCAGLDGTPWPKEKEKDQKDGRVTTMDDKDYYRDHKASPLSEIEMADTRKPITRATDGTADSVSYGDGKDVTGWRPEQLDTAEEALRRATEIWKRNAMRGDPDSPHGRVLRELRGEWF